MEEELVKVTTIRLRLSDILKEKGLTQRQASAFTGISENGISKLTAAGVRQIKLDTILSLCAGLDIKPKDLFELTSTVEQKSKTGG